MPRPRLNNAKNTVTKAATNPPDALITDSYHGVEFMLSFVRHPLQVDAVPARIIEKVVRANDIEEANWLRQIDWRIRRGISAAQTPFIGW
jgi:hypothetical protein